MHIILNNPMSALNVRESPKSPRFEEIGVEEHDGDVRFKSESGNMGNSACAMHQALYRNSSVIVDLAMGQIPRSTERISSYLNFTKTFFHSCNFFFKFCFERSFTSTASLTSAIPCTRLYTVNFTFSLVFILTCAFAFDKC